MNLQEFNRQSTAEAEEAFKLCCGSRRWVTLMLNARPFADVTHLLNEAKENWFRLDEKDWLEAFSHHPKIGDLDSLKKRFVNTAHLAGEEQRGAQSASDGELRNLQSGNARYEEKFGFIFIVCATGKTAAEMLSLLNDRLTNSRAQELKNAAEEQAKITHIRLTNLLLKGNK